MAILNAKEKELVNKYASQIRCALDSDYARAMPASVLQKFVEMFDKYTNNTTTLNYSCGQCQLNFLKRLGNWLRKNNDI